MERGFGNWYAWSHHGGRTYSECPRRWWLMKVLFWGGWQKNSDPARRRAWQLTKMKTVWTLSGTVVHQIAAETVSGEPARTPDQAVARYEYLMARGWNQSRNGAWRDDPKHRTCLFEHYYMAPWAKSHLELAKEVGRRAVRNLFETHALRRAREGRVIRTEVMEDFLVEDVPARVQLDVEVEHGGRVYLTDWKSGVERLEHLEQANVYVLSRVLAGVSRRDLWVSIVYLPEGREVLYQPSEDDLARARRRVLVQGREIRAMLRPPAERNRAARRSFPMTTDVRACRGCIMHHACKGRTIRGVTRVKKEEMT